MPSWVWRDAHLILDLPLLQPRTTCFSELQHEIQVGAVV